MDDRNALNSGHSPTTWRTGQSRRSRPTPWTLDVGVWLRSLGLGQYEAAFRDNEVDGEVLPKLTVDDLKDLGVAIVGHRRKIMSAIEQLNAASSARAEGANAVPTKRHVPVGASSDAAERRPITGMFCDLVGSTSLAARLDAEDWRNLVGAYLDAASQAVTGFGGHVLKRLGDGLMACSAIRTRRRTTPSARCDPHALDPLMLGGCYHMPSFEGDPPWSSWAASCTKRIASS